jgi:hypothetical protein
LGIPAPGYLLAIRPGGPEPAVDSGTYPQGVPLVKLQPPAAVNIGPL